MPMLRQAVSRYENEEFPVAEKCNVVHQNKYKLSPRGEFKIESRLFVGFVRTIAGQLLLSPSWR